MEGPGFDQVSRFMKPEDYEAVIRRCAPDLMQLPGVVGVGLGEYSGRPCIKVLVVKSTPALLSKIPSHIERLPVHVSESGQIQALDNE